VGVSADATPLANSVLSQHTGEGCSGRAQHSGQPAFAKLVEETKVLKVVELDAREPDPKPPGGENKTPCGGKKNSG
jgi:hypothetical protein